jgi:hypothetical protein
LWQATERNRNQGGREAIIIKPSLRKIKRKTDKKEPMEPVRAISSPRLFKRQTVLLDTTNPNQPHCLQMCQNDVESMY